MIGKGTLDAIFVAILFAPLVVPAIFLILGLLCGLIRPTGIWRNSFAPEELSPARIVQFIATVAAASGILIALAQTGATSFPPVPEWLAAAAGGGNLVYLGTKLAAARRFATQRVTTSTGG